MIERKSPGSQGLKALAIARQSYGALFQNLDFLIATTWPWLALEALLVFMLETAIRDQLSTTFATILEHLPILLTLIAGAAIAVSWMRWQATAERRTGLAALRFGRREGRFLLVGLGTALMASGGIVPASLLAALAILYDQALAPWALMLAGLAGSTSAVYLFGRLVLALPLCALDWQGNTIAESWRLSRRHGWRLSGLILLIAPPLLCAVGLYAAVATAAAVERFAWLAGFVAVSFAGAAIGGVALSRACRTLSARPPLPQTAQPSPIDTLCDQLEQGLGPFGFQWLCACAVFPGLRFPLTVHLGQRLARSVGRAQPDEDEHLALCRLPWFRTGWMPEDLRLALLQRISPDLRETVRATIEDLLFNVLDDRVDPDVAAPLDFARPPSGWRGLLHGWLDAAPATAPGRDAIFVHYMMGRVPKPSDLRLNRVLAHVFGARVAGWLDRRTLEWAGLAVVASVLIWIFADSVVRPVFTDVKTEVVTAPRLIAVPAGSFLMGSPEDEPGRDSDEGPRHEVTLPRFAIGRDEITVGEYRAFVEATGHESGKGCYAWTGTSWDMRDDADWRSPGFEQGDDEPVVCVSWEDAQAYVAWLATETGEAYRLPTEAEWEYAARAGTETPYAFGETITPEQANFNRNVGKTTELERYPANAWGLRDMHGNVWEWVEDCYHGSYEGAPTDGSAWVEGDCTYRVVRGGSWDGRPEVLRSADRDGDEPGLRDYDSGFRVARTLTP